MKGVQLLDIIQENDMMLIVNWTHWLWHLTVTKVTKMPGHWRTLEIKLEHYLSLVKGHSHNNGGILVIIDDLIAIVNILPLRKGIRETRARRWREPRFLALGRQKLGQEGPGPGRIWPGPACRIAGGRVGPPAGVIFSLQEVLSCSLPLLTVTVAGGSHWPSGGGGREEEVGERACGRWRMGRVPGDRGPRCHLHTSCLHQGCPPRLSCMASSDLHP